MFDQVIHCVKNNMNTRLEISKCIHSENINDLYELISEVESRSLIKATLYFDLKKGYLIKCKNEDILEKNLNEELMIICKKKDITIFTTIELQKLNNRIIDSYNQIVEISGKICVGILMKIKKHILSLQKLSDELALVDVVLSFYLFSKKYKTCIAEFSDSIIVKDGLHPFLNFNDAIPNSYYACPLLSFNIITGSNMSGKTTYMKQIGLLVIMAQIGCPIPAGYASFKVFKSLLTRLSNEDCAERKLSTFGLELSDTKTILELNNEDSLVLIDEIGRGTGYLDGLSFSIVVSKNLIFKKSYVFFITHFTEIINYLQEYPTVNVLKNRNFKVSSGVDDVERGIEISTTYLPPKVINEAIEIKNELRKSKKTKRINFNNSYLQLAIKIQSDNEKNRLKEEVIEMIKNQNDS